MEFTERCATVFKRKLEMEMKEILEVFTNAPTLSIEEINEATESDDWNLHTFSFKEFVMDVDIDYSADEEKNYEIKLDSLQLVVRIRYKNTRIGHIVMKDDFNIFYKKIDELVKEYQICPCGQLGKKDGWCRFCFPYVSTQEDICSICRENEGVWVELKCKHLVHKHCWMMVVNKKCPLCRVVHQYNDYERI